MDERNDNRNNTHAAFAELEAHIDVVFVFNNILEANDVGVIQGLLELNLGIELSPLEGLSASSWEREE
jgi:hypothetical protein